jgi:hypothetical protein
MKNRLPFLIITALAFLIGCAATERGPDESEKTSIASKAGDWAAAFNNRSFDKMVPLYGLEVDFNGRPMKRAHAVFQMEEFMTQNYAFDAKFAPGSWKLDSMRGDTYAGHLIGHAKFDGVPDSIPLTATLQMRLKEDSYPFIVRQSDNIGAALNTLKERKKQLDLAGLPFDESGNPSYYYWEAMVDSAIVNKRGILTHIGKYQDLFYVYARSAKENGKAGMFDVSGKELIPMAYDDLGTIGIFAPSTVEVKKGTLKGLARLDGSLAIPVEYDALLPGFNKDGVAIWAQKGTRWQAFNAEFSPAQAEGGSIAQGPKWAEWLTALPFDSDWDSKSEFFKGAFLAELEHYEEKDTYYMQSYFLVRLPFAITERHLFADLYGGGVDWDNGTRYSVDSIFTSADGKTSMLTTVENWGIGGRESYHDEELHWVVFEDELRDTAQSVTLYRRSLEGYSECSDGGYALLGDTLIQTHQNANLLDGYYTMPYYQYFRINAKGRLEQVLPERAFPFMSLVKIDQDFLKGCFYGGAEEDEAEAYKRSLKDTLEEWEYIVRTAEHFRASDLDYLVNEVYAAHGLRFKTPKWQEYFVEKSWYKPSADNVDALLSPIERSNIEFVRNIQSKVKLRENDYTRPQYDVYEGI